MKEADIRPAAVFDEFLNLSQKDVATYFIGASDEFSCPACGSEGIHAFVKNNLSYKDCPNCQTLFVSPRPSADAFSRYYQESESAKYWASTFYKETVEARREKLWRPKALLLQQTLEKYSAGLHDLVDIGGGYGIFAEEYEKLSGKKVTVIEPGPALAQVCRDKGLQIVQEFLENINSVQLGNGAKAFVSFELFEHLRHLQGKSKSCSRLWLTTG